MCLIVYKRNGLAKFTNRQFKNMITNNEDGLGMMWREGGRVKTVKTMGNAEEKFRIFKEHRDKPYWAMHARYRTHGDVNLENCHPYKLLDKDDGDDIDLYVMHNGTLDAPNTTKGMSDTWHWMEYIMKPIVKANVDMFWESDEFKAFIKKNLGGSKLLFMRSDNVEYPVLMLNVNLGWEVDGCWLSNNYGCREPYVSKAAAAETNYKGTTLPSTTHNRRGHYDQESGRWVDYKDTAVLPKLMTADEIKEAQDEFDKRIRNNDVRLPQKDTDDGKNFLPDASNDDKIVEFKPRSVLKTGTDVDDSLLFHLQTLRSQSDQVIKEFIKDDPDLTADIVLGLYAKNTLDYETIMKLLKTESGVENMVNLIRHMTVEEDKQSKTKTLNS